MTHTATVPQTGATTGRNNEIITRLERNIASVVLGKTDVIRMAITALLAEGHILMEDVPGVGKTLLAKALARSIAATFHRIQFTPDLLPGDLLGTSVFHQPTSQFVFQPGPIFAQIILADEINRATPRTQSALLEAMSERQVTLEGQTRRLGPPFFVLATQNPYEFEGTYPLPESQLDRFLMRIEMGYPDRQAERDLLLIHRDGEPVDQLQPALQVNEMLALQDATRRIKVSAPIIDYILEICEKTRVHPDIVLGASTRAAISLYHVAQARALIEGREYVVPDDVKQLAIPVLAHRLLSRRWTQGMRENTARKALQEILDQTPIPQ